MTKTISPMFRKMFGGVALTGFLILSSAIVSPVWAADETTSWDGLVQVRSKKLAAVYLMHGADFRPYTKVMIDPTEAAMTKNWLRDYNRDNRDLSMRLDEKDVEKALEKVRTGFGEVLAKAYSDAGYPVVTTPGPDVLQVRTAIVNLTVNAPDLQMGRGYRSAAPEAGMATLVVEARDSQTHAVLGRAVDRKIAGDMPGRLVRNSVSNRQDFLIVFKSWAKTTVAGLAELKAMAKIDVATLRK